MAESEKPDTYLTGAQVCQRYGGVSDMTIHRWRNDSDLNFPKPEPIRKRNYWRVAELDAWDNQRKAATAHAA